MKLLIDANIILDVLQKREPHCSYSSLIWKYCESGKAIGYVSVLSFMNISYVLRKELSPQKIESIYKSLSLIFNFADLTSEDVQSAAHMKLADFEDAVQIQTAIRLKAEYIITRNIKDFKSSSVLACTPYDFINFKI